VKNSSAGNTSGVKQFTAILTEVVVPVPQPATLHQLRVVVPYPLTFTLSVDGEPAVNGMVTL
jgi:hypothetical protein